MENTSCRSDILILVNSRPHYPSSDGIWESPPVTRNDFLIGHHFPPPAPEQEERVNLRHLMRSTEKRVQEFWKCWIKYFTPNSLPRNKWYRPRENLQEVRFGVKDGTNSKKNISGPIQVQYTNVKLSCCVMGCVTTSGHVLRGHGAKSKDVPSRDIFYYYTVDYHHIIQFFDSLGKEVFFIVHRLRGEFLVREFSVLSNREHLFAPCLQSLYCVALISHFTKNHICMNASPLQLVHLIHHCYV